jgi:hypothetical protein
MSRDKGIIPPLHRESRNPKHEMKSARGAISTFQLPGCQETKGRSSTTSESPKPETRNVKCPDPFQHFGYQDVKRQRVAPPLHRESPKPETRNVKAPRSHFGISATGMSRDKGPLLHCIGNHRNPKREMKNAQEPFQHFGYRDVKRQRDHSSTAFQKSQNPKCEMKNPPEPFRNFNYQDVKRQRAFLHCIENHRNPKREERL